MGIYVKAKDLEEGRVISRGRDNWVYDKRTRSWEWKKSRKGSRKGNPNPSMEEKTLRPVPTTLDERTSAKGLWGHEFSSWLKRVRNGEFRCHYCGDQATTVDHKWPRSQGGKTVPGNVVAACKPCNNFRGHGSYDDFKAFGWKRRPFAK
jgi:5-methylcytosine-specific restriction endonuclease McrA